VIRFSRIVGAHHQFIDRRQHWSCCYEKQGLPALARWLRAHMPQECRPRGRNDDARDLRHSRQDAIRAWKL